MCLFFKEFININLLSIKRYGVNPPVLCQIVIWFWNWGQIQAIGRCYRWFLGRCDRLFNGLSMSADHHLWLHHWSNTPLGSEATISSGEDEGGMRGGQEKVKQARKSSEDAQAGYAQFEKVWTGFNLWVKKVWTQNTCILAIPFRNIHFQKMHFQKINF